MNGSNRIRLIRARAKSDAEQSQSVAAKAVGYIRVSTEEQAVNGHGLEVQERAIRSFAESQGYELLEVIADPGISGARAPADRPGFRRVLQLAQERAFSMLLVWKFDRLARSLLFSVTTVNELQGQSSPVGKKCTVRIRCGTWRCALISLGGYVCPGGFKSKTARGDPNGPSSSFATRNGPVLDVIGRGPEANSPAEAAIESARFCSAAVFASVSGLAAKRR